MLIGDILSEALATREGALAAVDGRVELTYGELERRTNGFAHALRAKGIAPGDRVGMLLGTGVAFLEVYIGLGKAGAIAVPITTRASATEVAFLVAHAGCRCLIHDRALADRVAGVAVERIDGDQLEALLAPADERPEVTWSEHDDGAIFYTSGTTGSPKGVRLTQAGLMWCATTVRETYAIGPEDVALCQLPLSHVTVHFVPFPLLLAGGTIVLDDGFNTERTFAWMERYDPTIWVSVTATATLLAKHAFAQPGERRLERLRKILTGGSHVPDALRSAWRRLAPRATLVNCYGMTEMASAITRMDPDAMELRPGSVGLPYPGVQVRIGDGAAPPGTTDEVFVRAPSIMAGYWANPAATGETLVDGWLRTGDMGYLDEDGYVYLVGRRSQRLKRGGETIFPGEVESVIAALDPVKEVSVVGRHDEVMGDRLVAVVAQQPGAAITAEEIVTACAERLADFKVPEFVAILPGELPKNATGKIDTHGLDRLVNSGGLALVDLRRGSVRHGSS
ncbi:MAG TPA: AMP-binding protein [Solirubrobacter sp.]|nr:AMP-binding protein [Solirubrobacter sp.]